MKLSLDTRNGTTVYADLRVGESFDRDKQNKAAASAREHGARYVEVHTRSDSNSAPVWFETWLVGEASFHRIAKKGT